MNDETPVPTEEQKEDSGLPTEDPKNPVMRSVKAAYAAKVKIMMNLWQNDIKVMEKTFTKAVEILDLMGEAEFNKWYIEHDFPQADLRTVALAVLVQKKQPVKEEQKAEEAPAEEAKAEEPAKEEEKK